ncbi:uncharacterized protein LOC131019958 isoform X6 [Salvia miltiorrhiza]|uniref:uncharacterized protein LOC131019958 isoform X6 n=1 Tax=Salvia miltiorrhiza TaxID=226208 RepID=UPI0025AD3898|nr:uncharacterized protein LOC131019958 isoform X6 [Salvia miltiorrhiza]
MGTSAEEVYAAFLEKSVQFISIYLESKNAPQAALVEMENPKQASSIITEMGSYPFMILGMPRPIRASAARLEMFDDRPRKPGRKILCRWLDPKEPEFQEQRAEEEKLASQQSETLLAQYKKYDLLQAVFEDGSAKRLGRHYEMPVADA